jgi:exopolysaccharide biosynthesis WecB/TagA/CpsF family protein
MTTKRITFFGMPLDVGADSRTVCDLLRDKKSPRQVAFAGPGAWDLARKRPDYLAALQRMTLVLPEGEGVSIACRLLTGEPAKAQQFDDLSLAKPFLDAVRDTGTTLALVGGAPGVDETAAAKMQSRHPGIVVVDSVHGFGEFSAKITRILSKNPECILVSMQTPRQEAFMTALMDAGYQGMIVGCGDYFDDLASVEETVPPEWVARYRLASLYRFREKPAKRWQRYVIEYPLFAMPVVGERAIKAFKRLRVVGEDVVKEISKKLSADR